jgi:hypothetical protein
MDFHRSEPPRGPVRRALKRVGLWLGELGAIALLPVTAIRVIIYVGSGAAVREGEDDVDGPDEAPPAG